jgi:hypothetical protein
LAVVTGTRSMTILVHVEPDDIAKGLPGKATSCPVALALWRSGVFPNGTPCVQLGRVRGGNWTASASRGPKRVHLSENVARFMLRFDAGKSVEPFAFRVFRP